MSDEELEETSEGVEELDDLDDDEFDADLDTELDDGPIDDDLALEEDPVLDDGEVPPSRSAADGDLTSLDYEQMLKVNPKRAKMLKKRARKIEGILDNAELETEDGASRAWAKLSEDTNVEVRRTYAVADDYSENDVLEHPKFGVGFVVEIMSERKVKVLFEDGVRRLVYNVQK